MVAKPILVPLGPWRAPERTAAASRLRVREQRALRVREAGTMEDSRSDEVILHQSGCRASGRAKGAGTERSD